jgi:hypothetical protein
MGFCKHACNFYSIAVMSERQKKERKKKQYQTLIFAKEKKIFSHALQRISFIQLI